MIGTRTVRSVVVVFTLCVSLLITGIGLGQAATYWSGYSEVFRSPANWCSYVRENYRDPAGNPSNDFDYNGWHYMRDYQNGCSPYNTPKTFGSGNAMYALYLTRASDGVVCSSIGLNVIPSNNTAWGVGRGYNRSGTCSSTTQFTLWHIAQSGMTQTSVWWDFTYVP